MNETSTASPVVLRNRARLSSLLIFPTSFAVLGILTSVTNLLWEDQSASWVTVLVFSMLATIQPIQATFAKFSISRDEFTYKVFFEKEMRIKAQDARWYTIEKTSKWAQFFMGYHECKVTIRHTAYDDFTFTTDREEVLNWLAQHSELKEINPA